MHQIKKIYNLWKVKGKSIRSISLITNIPKSTISDYISRFNVRKISFAAISEKTEGELHNILFTPRKSNRKDGKRAKPDFSKMYKELKLKHVTLRLLWEEYLEQNSDGYRYSEYCRLYQGWKKNLKVTMRQHHVAGEKMFVDYAGMTMKIYDSFTGEYRKAQIFVATLGASGYSYAEATFSQNVGDFVNSHLRAFEFFGGTTKQLVPDNLKSAVIKADYYNPKLNSSYEEMAEHYGILINPARVRKPKDKAKVELSVLLVERWILAKLRYYKFFSLNELNSAIKPLVKDLNNKVIKKIGKSRFELFQTTDMLFLNKLPAIDYTVISRKLCNVDNSYHVCFEGCFYSVPNHLIGKEVLLQYNQESIEIYYQDQRVAIHVRGKIPGCKSTLDEHMTKSHLSYSKIDTWNMTRLLSWAGNFGEKTKELIEFIHLNHPVKCRIKQCCLGILNNAKNHNKQEVELTSEYMVKQGKFTVKDFKKILKNKPYKYVQEDLFENDKYFYHRNIRGSKSYS